MSPVRQHETAGTKTITLEVTREASLAPSPLSSRLLVGLGPAAVPRRSFLHPAIARRFVDDMRAFHAESNAIKADEIAARLLHAPKQHYVGKLRLSDVKEMFEQMRDHA
jgi:hypothetical protein